MKKDEIIKTDVKARLVSQKEVIDLLIEKRSYASEDNLLWDIYTYMIQNVKQLPDPFQQKPVAIHVELLRQLESLADYIPAEVYTKKVIEIKTRIQPSDLQKEVERLKEQIVSTNEFILEVAKYDKETTSTRLKLWAKAYIKKYTNINIEALNK